MGSAAVHTAASCGSIACLKILLEREGSDINEQDKHGNTILHKTIFENHIECARWLIAHGADVNMCNQQGESPLHKGERLSTPHLTQTAVEQSHVEYVRLLLEAGATPTATDQNLTAPIHLAAQRSLIECTDMLLVAGAKLNVRNHEGWSPLHFAAKKGDPDFILKLIDCGEWMCVIGMS